MSVVDKCEPAVSDDDCVVISRTELGLGPEHRVSKVVDDPAEALRTYVSAKMEFSRNRPYGSKVWAREIMSGAPVLENFLGTTLKTWLTERTRIIRRWIRDEKIKPLDPQALLYMIWATTQHYADFERQMIILNGGKEISDRSYKQRTEQVIELILTSAGLNPLPSNTAE